MEGTSRSWVGKLAVLGLTAVGVIVFSSVSFGGPKPLLLQLNQSAIPHTFSPNTPAVATEVNENFQYLLDLLVNKSALEPSDGGHIMMKAPTPSSPGPTLGECDQNSKVVGTDSVGSITIGGATRGNCSIMFGTSFSGPTPPVCTISSSVGHTNPLSVSVSLDHFVVQAIGGEVLMKDEVVSYICIGLGQ